MTTSAKDPIRELKSVLAEHLPWHGARIGFLAQFLLALLKVRSVSLAELATGFGGPAKVESHYKRLQRFFRGFAFDQASLARLLVRLVGVGDGPWRLTMDRTHWRFGKTDLNFLVLGIACRGIALPVFWSVLDKPGNSDTAERIALMERFLATFGASRIAALLADREFVGEDWFCWLQRQRIPFHQRLKRDTRVPNVWNRMMRLDELFGSLAPGERHRLPGRRPVWGCFVHLSALRLDDGEFLFVALLRRTPGRSPRRLRRPLAGGNLVRLPENARLQLRGHPSDRPRAFIQTDGPARLGLRVGLSDRRRTSRRELACPL
jgi:hypothetical protein